MKYIIILLSFILISCNNYYYRINYKDKNIEIDTTCRRYYIYKSKDEHKIELHNSKGEKRERYFITPTSYLKIKKRFY